MLVSIILTILIGALIGWLASLFMGGSASFLIYCIVGIVGSLIGGVITSLLKIKGGLLVQIVFGVIGSCILIALLRAFG